MGQRALGLVLILVELILLPSHPVRLASGLDNAAGELDDKVPVANFHVPSKTVFHENGTVGEESAADGVGTSGSGSTAGTR